MHVENKFYKIAFKMSTFGVSFSSVHGDLLHSLSGCMPSTTWLDHNLFNPARVDSLSPHPKLCF